MAQVGWRECGGHYACLECEARYPVINDDNRHLFRTVADRDVGSRSRCYHCNRQLLATWRKAQLSDMDYTRLAALKERQTSRLRFARYLVDTGRLSG